MIMTKGFLIAILVFAFCCNGSAQEQIEKIFDPAEQDWSGINLGQPGYANAGVQKIGNDWYFVAFNENSKVDIWKTDLTQTQLFADLEADANPVLRGNYQDWLIYTDAESNNICRFRALNVKSKQIIDLIQGEDCTSPYYQSNYIITDKYLMVAVKNEMQWIELSSLPSINIKRKTVLPENDILNIITQIDDNRIVLRNTRNPYSTADFFILNLNGGQLSSLNDILKIPLADVSDFILYENKFYFQVTTEPYVERLMLSCDLALSSGSVKSYGNIMGNLLFIENDKAFISDFGSTGNLLGIYDVNNFVRTGSLSTGYNLGFSLWENAVKLNSGKFLLYNTFEYFFLYDINLNKLTNIDIDDVDPKFALPWIVMESGIVMRFKDEIHGERMVYFPFSDLKPIEFFKDKTNTPFELNILTALPGNRLLGLVFDDKIGSEYAVIDVLKDEHYYLKDIHTANPGTAAQVYSSYVLPDHQLLIQVGTSFGNVGYLFNPITKEGIPLLDSTNNFYQLNLGYAYGTYGSWGYGGQTEFSNSGIIAHNDSIAYFTGRLRDKTELKLFALNFRTKQIKIVGNMNDYDKLFHVGEELYVVRIKDAAGNQINRQILHLKDGLWTKIFEAQTSDQCYDEEDINQYFIHNGYLYFTSLGRLWSLNSVTNNVVLLVNNLINRSDGCYVDGVVFGNFFVRNNEVYFTESRQWMFYFYIAFLGFTSEIESAFWKTNGTIAGTSMLELNNVFFDSDNFLGYRSHLFLHDNEIYLLGNYTNTAGTKLYKWQGSSWQLQDVLVDDTLKSVIPDLVFSSYSHPNLNPGLFQRSDANWDGISYFQTTPVLINDTMYFRSIYTFKGGSVPELRKNREYLSEVVNSFQSGRSAYSTTQIGDKWYFPFDYGNNVDYTYYPEIIQQNLRSNRIRSVINNVDDLRTYSSFIIKDESIETGYFILGKPNSYNSSLYRLNNCPLIDEPVLIHQNDSIICKNQKLILQIEGLGGLNWIFITVNGIEQAYKWTRRGADNSFSVEIDLEEGDYNLSYYLDTGCELDSLASFKLKVDGVKPEFSILQQQVSENLFSYTSSDPNAQYYEWLATGGQIESGQGSSEIFVDWGQSSEGTVSLVAANGNCFSDTIKVSYSRLTSTPPNKQSGINIYPNPSSGLINISLPYSEKDATYQLMSIDGNIIDSGFIRSNLSLLDFSKVSAGLYVLVIKNNNLASTHRLVLTE
jgi:hypothetical protein